MSGKNTGSGRWLVAIMGTLLQLCLGTVYAWSFFQKPIMASFGWTNSQTAWTFSLAICFLGLAAAWGGVNLPKYGPRKLAIAGGVLFALGYFIGAVAFALKSLPLLWIGYGVIGGSGLGLGYVTPVATAAKWFPDKKGLVTGMVIMGFGFGALLMSKLIAPVFMAITGDNLVLVFVYIGILMLVLTLPAASLLRNPPAGFLPPGYTPPASESAQQSAQESLTARQSLASGKFLLMWLVFFLNITSGIMFIGFQSPMMQDLVKAANPGMTAATLAAAGATLIAFSSIFNGLGRFLWGGISDRIGRTLTFRLILGTQILVFVALLFVKAPLLFGLLVCYVLLCYGGGFGTMPSYVLNIFGPKLMPVVYGTILTAWSAAGLVGPQIVAVIKDKSPAQAAGYTFVIGAVLLSIGFLVTFLLNDTRLATVAENKVKT